MRGITTSPALLAKSDLGSEGTLRSLAETIARPVVYQLTAPDVPGMIAKAERAADILGEQFVLKIAASPVGFEVAAQPSMHNIVCITAVFSTA